MASSYEGNVTYCLATESSNVASLYFISVVHEEEGEVTMELSAVYIYVQCVIYSGPLKTSSLCLYTILCPSKIGVLNYFNDRYIAE